MKKRYVVAGILAAAGLICGGIAYYQYYQDAHAGQEYEKIKEKVVTEEPKKPEETQKSTVEIPIDFQTLQNMNPDIYAWIKVPGTVIDYPIVQSGTDNSYYLNHSVEHDENKAGAIFTEDYNTKTFEDPNTVIYGHGMANGSMFDGLHQYMDRDFFDQNKEVIIYMPDKILHYQIFAAYLYDNRHLLQSFNFDNKDIYQAYLDMVFGIRDMKSNIDTAASVTADAYLFPTRSAEFVISIPLSVMEALSCGVPVIGYKSFENLNEITGSEGAITLVDNAEQLDKVLPEVIKKKSDHSLLEKTGSWYEVSQSVIRMVREENA